MTQRISAIIVAIKLYELCKARHEYALGNIRYPAEAVVPAV
jgi:hypothetical protein